MQKTRIEKNEFLSGRVWRNATSRTEPFAKRHWGDNCPPFRSRKTKGNGGDSNQPDGANELSKSQEPLDPPIAMNRAQQVDSKEEGLYKESLGK